MTVPIVFGCVMTFLFGLSIGSFMNVVIWRLPRNGSLIEPQWSYCPNCSHRLHGLDLVPLFSYLLRGRKCHYCSKPISSRYFWVELITAVLFVVLYFRFYRDVPTAVSAILFGAVLVPIFCVDLERFEIPTQLNLLVFVIALARDFYGIALHEPGHELVWRFVPCSLVGAFIGVAFFGTVRVLGYLWKRQEAMGLGDVLLARAMGAMLVSIAPAGSSPMRLIPIWVILSCGSGAIVGPLLILYRRKQAAASPAMIPAAGPGAKEDDKDDKDEKEEEEEVDDSSFGMEIRDILYVLWLEDAVEYVKYLFSNKKTDTPQLDDDDWTPAPTAVPFGPFMVVGFIATLLIGEPVTAMYLAYALPKAITPGAGLN